MDMRADNPAISYKRQVLNQLPKSLQEIWPTQEIQKWTTRSVIDLICAKVVRLGQRDRCLHGNSSHLRIEDFKWFNLQPMSLTVKAHSTFLWQPFAALLNANEANVSLRVAEPQVAINRRECSPPCCVLHDAAWPIVVTSSRQQVKIPSIIGHNTNQRADELQLPVPYERV